MFFSFRSAVLLSTLVFLALLVPTSAVRAQRVDLANGWGPSPLEIGKLPDYCQRFFLEKKLPPNCDGVHHVCAGKVLVFRTMDLSIPKRERQRIIGQAKTEVDYIFKRDGNQSCAYMEEARATQRNVEMMANLLR